MLEIVRKDGNLARIHTSTHQTRCNDQPELATHLDHLPKSRTRSRRPENATTHVRV